MVSRKSRIIPFGLMAIIIAGLWATQYGPLESATRRAYRLCRQCGLDDAEITQLVDDAAHSTLDRQGLIQLWAETFDAGDTHQELCSPCAEAVLDAAAVGLQDDPYHSAT